jgi:hypothetical protein
VRQLLAASQPQLWLQLGLTVRIVWAFAEQQADCSSVWFGQAGCAHHCGRMELASLNAWKFKLVWC